MDLDDLYKKIQMFFDEGTLTIVGSGLSCAEGIPGMGELSNKLIKVLPGILKDDSDIKSWRKIESDLKSNIDLESALQRNNTSEEIEKSIVDVTYDFIAEKDEVIFNEIMINERELKFSEYLSQFNTELYNLTVITTNYDLLIEYACEKNEIKYTDSFYGKIIARYSHEESNKELYQVIKNGSRYQNMIKSHIKIYKPHGSINWKLINNSIYKINRLKCGLPCIITPGLNKYEKGYDVPFDYHIGKMGEEIDKADKIVFIGYGFNDNHLETHLQRGNNISKPKLIITRTLSTNAKEFIEKNSNIIALEAKIKKNRTIGTKIYNGTNTCEISDKDLWDISNLIKEVF